MYEDYNYGGSFIGVIVNNRIIRKDIVYNRRSNCVSSCTSSVKANLNWRIPSSNEVLELRCAITAMGWPIDDTYWYDGNSVDGVWLFGDQRDNNPDKYDMYNDNSNYCTCVSDL